MSPSTKWFPASPFDLTHWFSGKKFNPGTPGVYQRRKDGAVHYSYWNGEFWCAYCSTVEAAYKAGVKSSLRSEFQDLPFRGLKHESNN